MSEIVIDWQMILPHAFFLRIYAGAVALGLFLHFLYMANFASPKGPWILGVLLGAVGGFSVGLFVSALSGNLQSIQDFSLGAVGSVLALWLWLWHNGLHVNEFIDRKYGQR